VSVPKGPSVLTDLIRLGSATGPPRHTKPLKSRPQLAPALGPVCLTLGLELTLRTALWNSRVRSPQSANRAKRPQPSPEAGAVSLPLEPVGGWRIIEACRYLPLGTKYDLYLVVIRPQPSPGWGRFFAAEFRSNYGVWLYLVGAGRKGGEARAAALTDEERSDIARKAAQARWAKAENSEEDAVAIEIKDEEIEADGERMP